MAGFDVRAARPFRGRACRDVSRSAAPVYTRLMRLTRLLPTRLLGSAGFAAMGKHVFPRADVALQRLTRGRLSLTAAAGMPLLLLETTGRRSGELRVTPLTYATDGAGGADFLVAGSNWGQHQQPGWALNLLAKPDAVVDLHGERIPVTARVLHDAEREAAWTLLLQIWPAYDEYVRRVRQTSDREILVFRLERA
jgi:deazaflavin-dependent oxidoreductase (nitroreductase family)